MTDIEKKIRIPFSVAHLEEALALAIKRELIARQLGHVEEQAAEMNLIRTLRLEIQKAGRK